MNFPDTIKDLMDHFGGSVHLEGDMGFVFKDISSEKVRDYLESKGWILQHSKIRNDGGKAYWMLREDTWCILENTGYPHYCGSTLVRSPISLDGFQ